jgi:hypothetical protein
VKQALLASALIALSSCAADAGTGYRAWHNGSIMHYEAEHLGGGLQLLQISYVSVRPGLSHAVSPGTILVRGIIEGNQVTAFARTFRSGCNPAPYPVSGTFARGAPGVSILTLTGYAPAWGDGCFIQGMTAAGPNARLEFHIDDEQVNHTRPDRSAVYH